MNRKWKAFPAFTDICLIFFFFLNNLQVTEGQASGVLLSTLQAKDPDEGENGTVFYSLSGIVFEK